MSLTVIEPPAFSLTRGTDASFWEPVIPAEDLASAPFPTLVVSGDWTNVGESARRIAERTFGENCDALARAIGAERAVIPGAAHGPQPSRPEAFNNRLRSFLDSASRHSLPDS